MPKIIDITGQRFGQLLVLEKVPRIKEKRGSHTKWKCQCDCGNIVESDGHNMRNGLTITCGQHRDHTNPRWRGVGDISGFYWIAIQKNNDSRINRKNGIFKEFLITIEEGWQLFLDQNKKCALSGVDLVMSRTSRQTVNTHTASLDRIDSNVGYTLSNCQWIHKEINLMKAFYTQEELLYYCRLVAYYKPDLIVSNKLIEVKMHKWKEIVASAKDREIELSVSLEYIQELLSKQNAKCAYTGLHLMFSDRHSDRSTTASLDRINSSIGYVEGNLQWVFKAINRIKNDLNHHDFVNWCRLVAENNPDKDGE